MASAAQVDIRTVNAQLGSAFQRGDAASIAQLYTAEGELFPANSDVIRGTAAIRAFWASVINTGLTGARLETTELETHGDTAIEVGHYQLFATGATVADQGKYLVIWKHDGGVWKLHRDIWTTSQPAPASAA